MKRSIISLVLTVALLAEFWGDAPPAEAAPPSPPTPTLTIVNQTLSMDGFTETVSVSGSGFPRKQAVRITAWGCAGTTCNSPAPTPNSSNPWIVQSGEGEFASQNVLRCTDLTQVVGSKRVTEVMLKAEDWDVRKNLPAARPKFSLVSSTPAAHVCPQPQL